MKTAQHFALCLCALLWLTACGARQPLVRTELIDVPVDRYIALPEALTAPLPYPAPPSANCSDRQGRPAVCAEDGLLWILRWREIVDRANVDRAAASRLGRESAAAGGLTSRDTGAEP